MKVYYETIVDALTRLRRQQDENPDAKRIKYVELTRAEWDELHRLCHVRPPYEDDPILMFMGIRIDVNRGS